MCSSCNGVSAANVAAAQGRTAAGAVSADAWKIAYSDGSRSAATFPDKTSAEIALARSPKAGKLVKA